MPQGFEEGFLDVAQAESREAKGAGAPFPPPNLYSKIGELAFFIRNASMKLPPNGNFLHAC